MEKGFFTEFNYNTIIIIITIYHYEHEIKPMECNCNMNTTTGYVFYNYIRITFSRKSLNFKKCKILQTITL